MYLIPRPGEIMIMRERERGMASLTLNRREGKAFTGRRRRRRK
jgi:hypothetical protein